jgi:hypothetical protein
LKVKPLVEEFLFLSPCERGESLPLGEAVRGARVAWTKDDQGYARRILGDAHRYG